ncbi:MAG TPA: glycosyltransferase [Solirubrobacteraceae bacterium]|jgi:cellulose synthase/poly-beta-1,6-N-acetylglucosamine synthase-like glycosyltransferase|nr:glycosyltransferase [Solirubrobacteraceae bacterium]
MALLRRCESADRPIEMMRTALEIVLWLSLALIVWTQLGYAALLALLVRILRPRGSDAEAALAAERSGALPTVSLIVAAHDEEGVIGAKVANALALDYPRELLEVIVACDGCSDATAQRAREAGADLVLELPRGGKIRAQDAAVAGSRGEIVAFSDANALWEPGALRALVEAFAEERVGYACGQVRFFLDAGSASPGAGGAGATNQEGLYWRYEMALRLAESRLRSITAGNGAIYATRRESYLVVDPIMGHDLSFPFNMVKRGWRAVYVPAARASEKMVPSIEGELARKRRMMSHTWPILLRGGILSPRGYGPGYALMILSHRLLRYATPFLHALAFAANVALLVLGAGPLYLATLLAQLALLAAAAFGGRLRARPLLVARYYVLTTAALALGLWDWLRHGTSAAWEAAEGTR